MAFAKSKRSTITLSSTESGDFDFGFDFSTSKILRGDQVPAPHAPASDGWKLIARDDDSKLTMSHQASGKSWQLILDRVGQGPMESHCWLHDETGRVYGIVIGTAQQNGIFAYRFEAEGKCRLVRYYRDHRGPIAAMSVSRDGAYLVSSSLDQTVKVWSLRGLEENDEQSPNALDGEASSEFAEVS